MNQYEAVLAATRQAALDKSQAASRSRNDREQAFLAEMEPVLRSEAARSGETKDLDLRNPVPASADPLP